MEAAWLVALIVIPLFFNIYSSRIFEPDKISLLRSLSLVILGAWLVKLVDEGRLQWDRVPREDTWLKTLWKTPLLAPVTAIAMVYLLATVLSVVPRISFFGSYQRLQGFYSTFSYLVIFAGLVANLRRRAQVDRIITTAILVSLPISMYGVLQRFEIDPVPWAGNVTRRIAANMGNAIFVAAYLIMVTPLTIGRIVEFVRRDSEREVWQPVEPLCPGDGLCIYRCLAADRDLSQPQPRPPAGAAGGRIFLVYPAFPALAQTVVDVWGRGRSSCGGGLFDLAECAQRPTGEHPHFPLDRPAGPGL